MHATGIIQAHLGQELVAGRVVGEDLRKRQVPDRGEHPRIGHGRGDHGADATGDDPVLNGDDEIVGSRQGHQGRGHRHHPPGIDHGHRHPGLAQGVRNG